MAVRNLGSAIPWLIVAENLALRHQLAVLRRQATVAGSSPSHTSAVCTTTTTGAPPDHSLARPSKLSHEMSFAPRSIC
jgi:hypothetical protein